MYFQEFPLTYYTLDDGDSVQVITNIFIRVAIDDATKNNLSAYDTYIITDGETPEMLADMLYRSTELYWIILHVNDILDPRFEWPLSNYGLIKYVESKYDEPYGVHHYVDPDGIERSSYEFDGQIDWYPVSNFEYEDILNESKRQIKIIKPEFIAQLVNEFKEKINL